MVTVIFLLGQNFKLTLLSILPVAPLIIYISFSSKIIKNYTVQCQDSKKKINGLADMILELFPVIQVYDAYKLVKGAIAGNGHNISKESIWTACQNASLVKWIESLPDGLNTNVGERGNQVSGGQAQRIQIERALCKNAPIILLDEPVSALDQDTKQSVLAALKELMHGRTVIHVTHHQETLDNSYTIYLPKL